MVHSHLKLSRAKVATPPPVANPPAATAVLATADSNMITGGLDLPVLASHYHTVHPNGVSDREQLCLDCHRHRNQSEGKQFATSLAPYRGHSGPSGPKSQKVGKNRGRVNREVQTVN